MSIQKTFLVGLIGLVPAYTSFALINFRDRDDIPRWAMESIEDVEERKIMTGFGDGSFRPKKQLNRAEALVLIMRAKGIDFKESGRVSERPFKDVPRGTWYSGAVIEAVNRGWIKGFADGTFRPGQVLNNAEWATLIKRAFEMTRKEEIKFNDVPAKVWFSDSVSSLLANGLVRRVTAENFYPGEPVTRSDAAWMIAQILKKPRLTGESKQSDFSRTGKKRDARRTAIKPRDFNPYKQSVQIEKKELTINVVPKEGGPFEIDLESDLVDMGTVRVKNTLEDAVELHSLELKLKFNRSNVGPPEIFNAQIRGAGVVRDQKVSRTGSIFVGGLELKIPSGEEKVFRVKIQKDPEEPFHYRNSGTGVLSLFQADASMLSTFKKENSDRKGNFRNAPTKIQSRKFAEIEFKP